jgi:hypothetical protein
MTEPRVVLTDQATGLIAIIPTSMPNCLLQHCNWHIAQNIVKRLAEKKYLAKKRKKIMNFVWWYIQNEIEAELIENKTALLKKLKISE